MTSSDRQRKDRLNNDVNIGDAIAIVSSYDRSFDVGIIYGFTEHGVQILTPQGWCYSSYCMSSWKHGMQKAIIKIDDSHWFSTVDWDRLIDRYGSQKYSRYTHYGIPINRINRLIDIYCRRGRKAEIPEQIYTVREHLTDLNQRTD